MKLNKKYIGIFSIIYTILLFVGIFLQNICYYFLVNGLFSGFVLYCLYTSVPDEPKQEVIDEPEEIKPIPEPEPKPEPEKPKVIHTGVIITEEELHEMREERNTWYSKTNKQIDDYISTIDNILKGEGDI